MILIFFKVTRGGDQKFWISALGPPPNEFGQGVYSFLICHTWGLRPQVHEICPPQIQGGWVGAGFEEDISHEPEVVDPKCGISNMNIPPDRIHLAGVPELKSKIFDHLPLSLLKKIKILRY